MKRKETYANLSWPLYIFLVAACCLFAKLLFDGLGINTSYDLEMSIYVFDVLIFVYGIVTCFIVYLLGKAIFAKIAGFNILYFNLGIIGFKKEKGKFKIYWGGKENYACKVEIIPNPTKKQNITLALFGGTITSLIAVALTYTLVFALNASATMRFFFILSSVFYFLALIGYMLPIRLDNINDGFRLLLIKKYNLKETYLRNQRNLEALYNDEKEIEYFDYGDNNDPLSMEGKIYNFFYAIRHFEDKELLLAATKALSHDYKFAVGEDFVTIALIAHVYEMCLEERFDELKEFFWKLDTLTRKTIINKKDLDSIKVGLYIEGKVEDSREGLLELINAVPNCISKYHFPTQIDAELKLIDAIKEEIYSSNPDLKL